MKSIRKISAILAFSSCLAFSTQAVELKAADNSILTQLCMTAASGNRAAMHNAIKESAYSKKFVVKNPSKTNPAKKNPLSYAQGCARVFSTRARLARSEWTVRAGARKAAQGFSRVAQGLRSWACDVKKLCKACASLFSSRARLWACFSTLKSLGRACAKIFSRRARLGACFSACRALGCWGVGRESSGILGGHWSHILAR